MLRITSWSVAASVVHPLGAPALLPPLWSALGSQAATHESETRARPVLPPPSRPYLAPHIATIPLHIPNLLLGRSRLTLYGLEVLIMFWAGANVMTPEWVSSAGRLTADR